MKSSHHKMLLTMGVIGLLCGCATETITGKAAAEQLHLIPVPVSIESATQADVLVNTCPITAEIADLGLPAEGYKLIIAADGIKIIGQDKAGLFYGQQTLKQLQASIAADYADPTQLVLPELTIVDYPRVKFRSMMLDVSRHFLPLADVKRHIDWMAEYKFNHLQMHLTDDQGWRVEIKKYPRLTEIGSKRGSAENPYGPYFYTQEEIKDLVAYAQARNITITPEIDIPGHCLAALASYPELGCTKGPYQVWNDIGISEDILCGGNPKSEEFLKDVFTEIAQLFPGPYIHIGGDECPVIRWESCPVCQAEMAKLNTTNPRDLQRRLTAVIVAHINSLGKRAIGWDELLVSGVPDGMIIMSWRGNTGALRSAARGLDSIIASYSHLYFDYAQGTTSQERSSAGSLTTLRRAYSFNPELGNKELTDKHLIGAQANLWAESIFDIHWLEHKAMPRMFALSEALWSPEEYRDYPSFQNRLMYIFRRLDAIKAEPRFSAWELPPQMMFEHEYTLDYGSLPNGMDIIYTLDNSDPATSETKQSYNAVRPRITDSCTLKMRLVLPSGAQSFWSATEFIRMNPDVDALQPGLTFSVRYGQFDNIEQMRNASADKVFAADNFDFMRPEYPETGFGYVASGYFYAAESGNYDFSNAMTWPGSLYVNGQLLISQTPGHGEFYSIDRSIYLTKGYHPFKFEYACKDFGQLQLYYAFNGERQMPLSGNVLWHIKEME